LYRVFGFTECLVVPSVWLYRVFGCTECLVVLCVWLYRVFGCIVCLVVLGVWLYCVFSEAGTKGESDGGTVVLTSLNILSLIIYLFIYFRGAAFRIFFKFV
jgi:hypothetical protein